MTVRLASIRRKRALAAALALGLVVALGVSAASPVAEPVVAAWTDSEHAETTVSAGSVAGVPGTLICGTNGLPLLASTVTVSWDAAPDAASYRVMLRNASGSEVHKVLSTTSRSATLEVGLLIGVLTSLLDLLLSGQNLYVYVVAEHSSGWVSEPSATRQIKPGLLGGLACVS